MTTAVAESVTFRPWTVEDSISPLKSALLPTRDHATLKRIAGSRELQQLETLKIWTEPWHFLVNYCSTVDEHYIGKGLGSPYQLFPALPYLQKSAHVLWSEPYIGCLKSRQVRWTWLVSCYMLGEALAQEGRLYLVQSKRAFDSVQVLRRQKGVYDRMKLAAPWYGPGLEAESFGIQGGHLRFSNGSSIVAVPEGAHYVQSHTPAVWWADEIQLQAEAEEAFYQALPACEKIILGGTAAPSWFCDTFLPGEKEAA